MKAGHVKVQQTVWLWHWFIISECRVSNSRNYMFNR